MAMTIQEVIDTILAASLVLPIPNTVDTVTVGDSSQYITGIVSTFLATSEVIERAVDLNANLIISHETIFYNHRDEVDWLRDYDVYKAKCRKIDENKLVIWRFHDYLHKMQPDMTAVGLLKELEWETCSELDNPFYCRIPPMTLLQLANHIKTKLGIENLRVIGDLDLTCRGIGLLPGFMGQARQIALLNQGEVDVVICGEIHEWETSEYVRDAVHLGLRKGLVVIGHAASEEPGMKWIVPWLQGLLPGISIHFVPTANLFHWL